MFGSILHATPQIANAVIAVQNSKQSNAANAAIAAQAAQISAGPATGIQTGGMPTWLKPVGIGLGVLVALFIVFKLVKK